MKNIRNQLAKYLVYITAYFMAVNSLVIIGTALREEIGFIQYSSYCVESGYNVDCNTLIPGYDSLIKSEIRNEMIFVILLCASMLFYLYEKYRNQSKITTTLNETVKENTLEDSTPMKIWAVAPCWHLSAGCLHKPASGSN